MGTAFQNYKKRVAIGSHEPLTFSLLSRPSSLWLPILTRRLQTLKVVSDKKVYVQRDPALKHFTLNGRAEVLLNRFGANKWYICVEESKIGIGLRKRPNAKRKGNSQTLMPLFHSQPHSPSY